MGIGRQAEDSGRAGGMERKGKKWVDVGEESGRQWNGYSIMPDCDRLVGESMRIFNHCLLACLLAAGWPLAFCAAPARPPSLCSIRKTR